VQATAARPSGASDDRGRHRAAEQLTAIPRLAEQLGVAAGHLSDAALGEVAAATQHRR
jgi:hypothetical protein